VGEEFFGAMAAAFVLECPPRSPVLASYGDELPEFIAGFASARDLAYLPDVARLEAAHTREPIMRPTSRRSTPPHSQRLTPVRSTVSASSCIHRSRSFARRTRL